MEVVDACPGDRGGRLYRLALGGRPDQAGRRGPCRRQSFDRALCEHSTPARTSRLPVHQRFDLERIPAGTVYSFDRSHLPPRRRGGSPPHPRRPSGRHQHERARDGSGPGPCLPLLEADADRLHLGDLWEGEPCAVPGRRRSSAGVDGGAALVLLDVQSDRRALRLRLRGQGASRLHRPVLQLLWAPA